MEVRAHGAGDSVPGGDSILVQRGARSVQISPLTGEPESASLDGDEILQGVDIEVHRVVRLERLVNRELLLPCGYDHRQHGARHENIDFAHWTLGKSGGDDAERPAPPFLNVQGKTVFWQAPENTFLGKTLSPIAVPARIRRMHFRRYFNRGTS